MTKYDGKPCPVCGTKTKRMYALAGGGGKGARSQHPRWWVCERGHQRYVEKGQLG